MTSPDAQAAERDDRGSVPLLDFLADAIAGIASDRSVAAIGREAVKDVRETIMETFFGDPDRGGEIGAPLNPLPSEIANDGTLHAITDSADLPSPSQIVDQVIGEAQTHGRGESFQQANRSWVDYILNRGKDETPYNPDRQHIKPEDEKEQRKEEEKDRDGNDRDQGRGGRC